MSRLRVAAVAVLAALRWRRGNGDEHERVVPAGAPNRRAETWAIALLLGTALAAGGFVALYVVDPPSATQWMGLALGVAFALLAAALIVIGRHLVVTEDNEEEYPREHPADQEAVTRLVRESGSRITRKRLLGAAGGTAGGALGAALLAPVVSLGPVFDTSRLYDTPWRRGRRLVDGEGRPMRAADVEQSTFYTAFPEGADPEKIGSPLVVVRLDPGALRLPPGRDGWAPGGILAYSKICTHAGCAIALYRTPLFGPTAPDPALVCPCHYSTFDPARGASVEFGPAGRPLPQLPLTIDGAGELRAAGNFSGPVGPSWWGVRQGGAT